MPLPVNIEQYQLNLFSSIDEMKESNLPQQTIERLLRLRELYTVWRNYPAMSTKEMVERDQKSQGGKQGQPDDDIKLIKILMGNLEQESRDWQRLVFNRRCDEIYNAAKRAGDFKSAEKANADYAKYNRLNEPDDLRIDPSSIVPLVIEPSSDPTVIGINPPKDWRKKMEHYKQKWRTEATDTDFVEVKDDE